MQTLVYEMKDSSADGKWVLICHSDDDLQISQHNSRKSYTDAPRTSLNLHLEECFSDIVISFILQTIIYKRWTNHKRPLLLAYPPSFRPRNTWSTPQTPQTLSREIEKKREWWYYLKSHQHRSVPSGSLTILQHLQIWQQNLPVGLVGRHLQDLLASLDSP